MAAAEDLRLHLLCPICLNMFTDPVTLNCGHNLCKVCGEEMLHSQDSDRVYFCPECRTRFMTRPTLERNTALCNVVRQIIAWQQREEATGRCVHHRQLLRYYCCEDMTRICADCCASDEHRGHQTMPVSEAAEKRRLESRNHIGQLVSEDHLDLKVQKLQENTQQINDKSASVKESFNVLFMDTESQFADLNRKIQNEISRQERQALLLNSILVQELKVMKDEHFCRIICNEDLSNMSDDVTVLQTDIPDLSGLKIEDFHCPDINEDHILETFNTGLVNIVTEVTRGIFVPETLNVTLNPETAGNNVDVSTDLKTVSWAVNNRCRSHNGERFEYNQVLSNRSFSSGRQYIEIETSETGNWIMGMAYGSIDRRGHQSLLGDNDKSWCLRRYDNIYSVTHQKEVLEVTIQPSMNRIRILLDYDAGQLSFYELSDQARHLHTFAATFTEPLHVAVWVWSAWVRIAS